MAEVLDPITSLGVSFFKGMLMNSEFKICPLLVLVLVFVRFCVLHVVIVFLVFALCPCVPVGEAARGFPLR